METPVWGQLSFQEPLPGERRNKHFVATPECRLMSRTAKAVLNRLSELVAMAHETNPGLFAVHDEIINRGYLRSAILQTASDKEGKTQVLLSLVAATEPSPKFREAVKTQVADRLMTEFPLLKGVVLQEASVSSDRDSEFFSNPSKRQVLAGQGHIFQYIESQDREMAIGPNSVAFDPEVQSKLIDTLVTAIGGKDEPVLEFFSGDNSVTGLLKEVSSNVASFSEQQIDMILQDGRMPEDVQQVLLPPGEQPVDSPPIVVNRDQLTPKLQESGEAVAVISYPADIGKAEIKGVTSKEFRHWIGNVVKPKKIVIMTDRSDGLRKDIGHMKLLGYELLTIRAVDAQPGRMDKIATMVVMQRKPRYQDLMQEQLIE
jgi:hypothetical protein